jgi:hypothetical protein
LFHITIRKEWSVQEHEIEIRHLVFIIFLMTDFREEPFSLISDFYEGTIILKSISKHTLYHLNHLAMEDIQWLL